MTDVTSCTVCALGGDHPGITLDRDGVCNLCRMDVATESLQNLAQVRAAYQEFIRGRPNPTGDHGRDHGSDDASAYDCLLMYSGGKDSTYMLDKFADEYGMRVLAYTFDLPFESTHAAANVRVARERIPATFVLDEDDDNIKRVMREVFNRPAPAKPGQYLDEKLPCVSCRTFFMLRAILCARRNNIRHILLCADPQQMLTMESDVRKVIKGFYRIFGRELLGEMFGDELETLLFAEDAELPKIIFPFVAERDEYDPERIAAELRAKGLYESSPYETHCTLFPLLNYYSFTNWGCMFYKLNASSHVRAVKRNAEYGRSTYSVKFPKALDIEQVENRLREVTLGIAAGEGDPAAQASTLVDIFTQLDAPEAAAHHVARGFLDMRSIADDLGIDLSDRTE
jgi:hypothetical protein